MVLLLEGKRGKCPESACKADIHQFESDCRLHNKIKGFRQVLNPSFFVFKIFAISSCVRPE